MRKLLGVVERLIEYIEFVLLFIVTGAIGAQVFSRALLNQPLEFPEELSMFTLIAIVLLGISMVEKENSHIKVEFFFQRMPRKGRKVVTVGGKSLTFILVLWILNGERELIPGIIQLKTTAGDIPYIWIHTIIVVSCVLWLVVIANSLVRTLRNQEL